MFIGFILLVIMAFIGASSKNVNVSRLIFVLGFVVCIFSSSQLLFLFVIQSIGWLIVYGGIMMGIKSSKAVNYLANKDNESKIK